MLDFNPNRVMHDFNPRSPRRERYEDGKLTVPAITISIHAPHGGSDQRSVSKSACATISIHAPHGGSDREPRDGWQIPSISIHAPHGGERR